MAKDPAFLFYSQDFFVGTATLSFEEKGKYIHLLCLMHQQGRLSEETIRLLVGSVSVNLKSKFSVDEKGMWFNVRLENETAKRNLFTESRRINGNLGGRPKNKKPKRKPKQNLKDNHTANRMGNEDVNENEEENKNEIIYPFDSENFKEAWQLWIDFKKQQFNFTYKSPISLQGALKNLSELSGMNEALAIKIILQSIHNGWQGLFQIKQNQNGTKQKFADFEQVFTEFYAKNPIK